MKLFVSTFLIALSWQSQVWAQGKPATVADLAAYNKSDREKVLYDGAKKEGKLMWYTSLTGGPNTEAPKVLRQISRRQDGSLPRRQRCADLADRSRVASEALSRRFG